MYADVVALLSVVGGLAAWAVPGRGRQPVRNRRLGRVAVAVVYVWLVVIVSIYSFLTVP